MSQAVASNASSHSPVQAPFVAAATLLFMPDDSLMPSSISMPGACSRIQVEIQSTHSNEVVPE